MHEDQYPIVCTRRQGFDAQLWRTPPLAVAAQAFLLAAALNSEIHPGLSLVLHLAAFFVGLAALHLFIKLRHFEVSDAELLASFERSHEGFAVLHGKRNPSSEQSYSWALRLSAYNIWFWVLVVLVLLAFGLACLASFEFLTLQIGRICAD